MQCIPSLPPCCGSCRPLGVWRSFTGTPPLPVRLASKEQDFVPRPGHFGVALASGSSVLGDRSVLFLGSPMQEILGDPVLPIYSSAGVQLRKIWVVQNELRTTQARCCLCLPEHGRGAGSQPAASLGWQGPWRATSQIRQRSECKRMIVYLVHRRSMGGILCV